MKVHVTARNLTLTPADQRMLDRKIERLEKRLESFDPDLVHLDFTVERHARKPEYTGSLRLFVVNRTLTAARNTADTPAGLIQAAFEDIEEQLDRFKAELRREPERKRGAQQPRAATPAPELPEVPAGMD